MELILNPAHGNSWRAAVQSVWGSGGWRGFWKGNALNVVRTAPFKAVNYFTFDTLLRLLVHRRDAHQGYERFVAGAGAGIVATLTCFPLDVLRTRMLSPAHSQTVIQTLWGMLRQEGKRSFYTGVSPALISMAMGGAVFYGTYDWLKSGYLLQNGRDPYEKDRDEHQMKLSVGTTLMFGAMAGVFAEIVTYPLEVVRRKMQLERTMASRRILDSPTGARAAAQRLARLNFNKRLRLAVRMSMKPHGVRGLYAGMLPNALQVLPSSALGYFMYELMKVVLDVRE